MADDRHNIAITNSAVYLLNILYFYRAGQLGLKKVFSRGAQLKRVKNSFTQREGEAIIQLQI